MHSQTAFPRPTVRQAAQWFMKFPQELTSKQQTFVEQLSALSPEVKELQVLIQVFRQMMRQCQSGTFDEWLVQAEHSAVPEIKGFATGIRQDYDAVKAALESEWSNGQVEGQINKLKLIKRQMYGRANFDLLKTRMLQVD